MHKFTDSQGDDWIINLTIGDVKPIECETGVNLLKMQKPFTQDADDWLDDDGKPLILVTRLAMDLELCVDVIFAACAEQASKRSVDAVAFGRRMGKRPDGTATIDDAYDAFWEELRDFFRQARQPHMVAVVKKQRAGIDSAMKRAEEMVQAIDTEAMTARIFGDSSGGPPASSELTREP